MEILTRGPRRFIGEEMDLQRWTDVAPFYEDLQTRPLPNADALRQWLADRSELESYLSENFAWRYIRMTGDTANAQLVERLNFFIEEIQPQMATLGNELDKRAVESPFLNELLDGAGAERSAYDIMLRSTRQAIELFREENVPLLTELQTKEREYGAIVGAMTVTLDGKELTLPQASDELLSTDRTRRETAWRAIWARRYEDHERLDTLYDELIALRHQVAQNAGFANFRDYSFAALGRFDYTAEDCFAFHESVAQAVVPLLNDLAVERKHKLGVGTLRPWDAKVDADGQPPLRPFETGEELLERTVTCFDRLDPSGELGQYLRIMRWMDYLDLESRRGKAPGGYNYPLEEIGVPFIFMNATGSLRDVVTMVHEGGHAVHSFLTRALPLKAFRNPPMEAAELASMSMELLSMDHWDAFFDNPAELRRAKIQHLESILETLPWVATIDKFQHWVYEHPSGSRSTHSHQERRDAWVRIYEQFTDTLTDWSGIEYYKEVLWQKQLHLFEVPFYYVEYGIAQLGAIGVWQNYRQDPAAGLAAYKNALKQGYTVPLREIYAAANVPFDFSAGRIASLMRFVGDELRALKN